MEQATGQREVRGKCGGGYCSCRGLREIEEVHNSAAGSPGEGADCSQEERQYTEQASSKQAGSFAGHLRTQQRQVAFDCLEWLRAGNPRTGKNP